MTVTTLSPIEAHRLVTQEGAVLIDIRERHEIAREQIAGALEMPLSGFGHADLQAARGRKAVFFCHSGGRTRMYAGQIASKADKVCEAYVLRRRHRRMAPRWVRDRAGAATAGAAQPAVRRQVVSARLRSKRKPSTLLAPPCPCRAACGRTWRAARR